MIAVVDASSVVAYLLGDGSAPEREALLDETHAPALLDVEVTQTLRGLLRGSVVTDERAEACLEDLLDLSTHRHLDAPLLARSWELRNVCSTYDAQYVALAEVIAAPLVTRDARLARGVSELIETIVTA